MKIPTKRIFNEIVELSEFKKDFKKLTKKFKTLSEDFEVFKNTQLKAFHKLKQDNKGNLRIFNLGIDCPLIYKVVKFACRVLKGRGVKSGIRVIYAYYPDKDKIEFIEIYYKGEKENEDRERILRYYSKKAGSKDSREGKHSKGCS
ncbi:MAG: hypothetical protein B6D55_07360 [Candidatus Omnitrophica bacterium 4484_70.2]|nr:MAG: hypothetical protein B6D55_07360 [Candidatus Omnitrophica bacterium 4484_70.2]